MKLQITIINSPIYLGCACDLLCLKEALGAKMKLKVITVM